MATHLLPRVRRVANTTIIGTREVFAAAAAFSAKLKPVCSWGAFGLIGADEVSEGEGWHVAFDWLGMHLIIGVGRVQKPEDRQHVKWTDL